MGGLPTGSKMFEEVGTGCEFLKWSFVMSFDIILENF
jgi:hypothetical protein